MERSADARPEPPASDLDAALSAQPAATAVVSTVETLSAVPRPRAAAPDWRGHLSTLLFVGPLLVVMLAFLIVPAFAVLVGAFRFDGVDGAAGGWTLQHIRDLAQPQYVTGLKNSVFLSGASALLGTVFGGLLAYAVLGESGPAWLRAPLVAFSGVAANFAGVPLALAFVATLGTTGIVTRLLAVIGLDLNRSGFSLFNFSGLLVVYLYFQIPLMVILIAPALEGLRREWREAAENLGATAGQFWRHVGLPILAPSLLASAVLLFGNAFSAYATAYALTSGNLALLPLQIGAVLSGNVISDPHLGQALALLVIAVMAVTMAIYAALERAGSKWRK
ncbi:ABC transporter permease subunit (plasmid) [Deinococcus sp. KNUC1210]|uniref:ABC transporter permease n=1 Tax=Deinococcus sp. KNUC1210 TaxID=2917691 RepID=UPI001EEFF88A|nr:ABC transporter permease subunit [Deinococcus sp. KNUC1210]ULH17229.1 ABC transporter permease subunit [Deinococcus sp. KNUC1210]